MYKLKKITFVFLGLALAACGSTYRDREVLLTSMAVFDPVAYSGLWYEVARFPVPFQSDCVDAEAEYRVISETKLSVRNACLGSEGLKVISGNAEVVGPGRLKVRLGGVPFAADYWVLWVDAGYETAVVGTPSGRAGWILNRSPEISEERLDAAREVLRFNGYDVGQLVMNGEAPGT